MSSYELAQLNIGIIKGPIDGPVMAEFVANLDPMAIEIKPAPAEFGDWEALMALLHAAFAFQHSRIDPPSSLHQFDAASIAVKATEENLFLALDGGEDGLGFYRRLAADAPRFLKAGGWLAVEFGEGQIGRAHV